MERMITIETVQSEKNAAGKKRVETDKKNNIHARYPLSVLNCDANCTGKYQKKWEKMTTKRRFVVVSNWILRHGCVWLVMWSIQWADDGRTWTEWQPNGFGYALAVPSTPIGLPIVPASDGALSLSLSLSFQCFRMTLHNSNAHGISLRHSHTNIFTFSTYSVVYSGCESIA